MVMGPRARVCTYWGTACWSLEIDILSIFRKVLLIIKENLQFIIIVVAILLMINSHGYTGIVTYSIFTYINTLSLHYINS